MKHYISIFILAFLLTGCSLINDSSSDCKPEEPVENITLSFQMISPNIGKTRADAQHSETDSEWPQFEDLINVNDFAFYIFLDNAADKPLVMKMSNIANSTDPTSMITGSLGAYTVTTVIPKKNLETLLDHELSPGSTAAVDFRVVVLANMGRIDYNLLAPADAVNSNGAPTTYQQFIENINALTFNLNNLYNPNEGDSSVDGLYKGSIPMFGMITAHTSEDLLYKSRPEERIYIGDIDMLRSLAKIQVIDNSDKVDGIYPYISSVTVEGITNMVYPVPDLASYTNGQQVHNPRFATRSEGANTIFGLGYLRNTDNAKGTTRFGYIPEQPIQYGNPVINITAQLDAERTQTYNIPMGGSADYPLTPADPGAGGFGANILRNHIYTLSVNKIAVGTPAEITVNVEDWTPSSFNLDFTESVIISNKLQWTPGSYQNIDTNDGLVVVKPWTTTADGTSTWSPLTGRFGIQSPVGATWTAYLLTTSGDNEAFCFLDKNNLDGNGNPSMVPTVSGIIDGKTLAELTIVSTDPDPAEQNRAFLQIVVNVGEGASGTVIEADLTPENTSYKYFTIIQNTL